MSHTTQFPADSPLVVTMWETYGCGMAGIARHVAEILNTPFYESAYSGVQLRSRADQMGWVPLQAKGRPTGGFGGRRGMNKIFENNAAAAREMAEGVLRDAETGGVFMGRNATVVLADRPNTLHVKLIGKRKTRIARAMRELGISEWEARANLEFEDQMRTQISMDLFDWSPMKSERFSIIVNTNQLDQHQCALAIAGAASGLFRGEV